MINIHEPSITLLDKIMVFKSLSSIWIGKGKEVNNFEKQLMSYLKLNNIVTVTSGTQALYEIFKLLKGLSNKKDVIISPLSYIGIGSSIKDNDFDIVYSDINKDHLSLSLKSIKHKVNRNTLAVVVQHYGGRPNWEIREISEYLKDRKIFLIEDCATVLGGKIKDKHLGSFGDFSIWSFDSVKIITTLDGGMIYCKNNNHLYIIENNIHLGLQDSPTTLSKFYENSNNWWIIDPKTYGTKNILNNVTASLGISQLKKIDKFIRRQRDIWDYYQKNINNPKIKLPKKSPHFVEESYFLFWVFCCQRDQLAKYLKENGIFSTFRYYPLNKTKLYHDKNILPNVENIYKEVLCIPCHKNLTNNDLKYIVNKINQF